MCVKWFCLHAYYGNIITTLFCMHPHIFIINIFSMRPHKHPIHVYCNVCCGYIFLRRCKQILKRLQSAKNPFPCRRDNFLYPAFYLASQAAAGWMRWNGKTSISLKLKWKLLPFKETTSLKIALSPQWITGADWDGIASIGQTDDIMG